MATEPLTVVAMRDDVEANTESHHDEKMWDRLTLYEEREVIAYIDKLTAERGALLATVERIRDLAGSALRGMPAQDGAGGFIDDMRDGDGEYLDSVPVDPFRVVQSLDAALGGILAALDPAP